MESPLIRLKDIAEMAGVTTATVSAALSGRGRVGHTTRAQIVKLAETLQYRPNSAARSLRKKPAVDIGLLLGDKYSEIIPDFIDLCDTENLSHQLEFVSTGRSSLGNAALLRERRAAHLVYVGQISDSLRRYIDDNTGLSMVTIDEISRCCVRSDFRDGTYAALARLRELGHRRIAMSHGYLGFDIMIQAKLGMTAAIADFGLAQDAPLRPVEINHFKTPDTMQASMEWGERLFSLGAEQRPTAVFCSGVHTARAVIYQAMIRGLRIPDDVSIVAIGTQSKAECGVPYIATVERDYPELLRRALLLLRHTPDAAPSPGDQLVPTRRVPRQTMAVCSR